MSGRCIHEFLPGQCALCMGARSDVVRDTPTTTARFAGPCPQCGDPLEVGDETSRLDERWICRPCAELAE